MRARRTCIVVIAGLLTVPLAGLGVNAASASSGGSGDQLRTLVGKRIDHPSKLSSGARTWLAPPRAPTAGRRTAQQVSLGSNVDANNPARDFAAGQSETAIAAQRASTGQRLVLTGWNDVSGFFAPPTTVQGSGTGVGVSANGGRSFTDLIGLPNNNVDQQWSGDPAIASLGDGRHFAVASLYYPSVNACTDHLAARGTIAVTIATVRHTTHGPAASFTAPIQVNNPGNLCALFSSSRPSASLAILDKDWLAYDTTSRTLAVSYTRFFLLGRHSGNGQIEVVRAHVPTHAATLSSADFGHPAVVWPEEKFCPNGVPSSEQLRCGAVNQGAYVAVAPGGDTYVAWERNIDSNLFDGDPYVYEHAARVPAGATHPSPGGPSHPVDITRGQQNSSRSGGVKSLDGDLIPGYSRGMGQDFPRLALDTGHHRVVFVWNDASRHPLGNIWLRAAPLDLSRLAAIHRVDDGTTYALHFLPAVSVRTDGTICTSWYDRRRGGATSTITDYVADCRTGTAKPATDVRITTGSTDWAGTSSLIDPNFGDYTDNATDGTRTYFTWSDGRIGVPQPFVDSR